MPFASSISHRFLRPFLRIDRYVAGEILGPFLLGCALYTLLLLLQLLLRVAHMIFARGVPANLSFALIWYSLPNILVLVIPMAFLFATLMAIGRLSGDSELTALRAGGVSLNRLYRPVFVFSLALALLTLSLMTLVMPVSNEEFTHTSIRIQTEHATQVVEPRDFYSELGAGVLWVFGSTPDRAYWDGVFLAQDKRGEVLAAERGRLVYDEQTGDQLLQLHNAVQHSANLDGPPDSARYEVSRLDDYETVVQVGAVDGGTERTYLKGMRSMGLAELRQIRDDPDEHELRKRTAKVEIHKRFSFPAACIGFGLFALPVAFSSRRGGGTRSSAFALSLLVLALYYIFINQGEDLAQKGEISPWLAMWPPNLILAALGGYFLWRRNRDRAWSGFGRAGALADRLTRTFPALLSRRSKTKRAKERNQRWSLLQFPSRNDRYILRLFVLVTAITMASMLLLFLVSRFIDVLEHMQSNNIEVSVLWRYLGTVALDMAYQFLPMAILIGTVLTFSLLSRSNEVIAWRAAGVSLFRLATPVVVMAILLGLVTFFIDDKLLTVTNREQERLENVIKNREVRSYRRADRQWLFGQGRFIYHYEQYDSEAQSLHELEVFEFDDGHHLIRRLYTTKATYQGEGLWVFESGWTRTFAEDEELAFQAFVEPHTARFPETPDYFEDEERMPAQMNWTELREQADVAKRSGRPDPQLQAQLHRKFSYPAATIAMALVALPFSFRLGRQGGALYSVGLALALAIAFFFLDTVFTTLAETAALPPFLGAWAPVGLFSILALYLFLGVRS